MNIEDIRIKINNAARSRAKKVSGSSKPLRCLDLARIVRIGLQSIFRQFEPNSPLFR